MNLKYGDSNYIVDHLQSFLQGNFSTSVIASGVYDKSTHKALLDYMRLPTIQTMDVVFSEVVSAFDKMLYYFTTSRNNNEIVFISKSNNQQVRDYIFKPSDENNPSSANYYRIRDLARSLGWVLTEFFNYNTTEKYKIILKARDGINLIPKETLSMINQMNNRVYYEFSLESEISIDKADASYKIFEISCAGNETFTIAHGYKRPLKIAVSSSTSTSAVKNKPIVSTMYSTIGQGKTFSYTTPPGAVYVYIQVRFDEAYEETLNESVRFRNIYEINDILVILGSYSDYNIRISEYADDPWLVNDKFIEYLLGQVVTQYSPESDIAYAHSLSNDVLQVGTPSSKISYSDDLKARIKDYQDKLNIKYSFGYLDIETEGLMLKEIG